MADTMTLDELKEAVADICAGCDTQRSLFTNAQLADALDAAIKQCEQDAKDAARYRWLLRDVGRAVELLTDADLEGTPAYEIDDAIESAMAQESGNG